LKLKEIQKILSLQTLQRIQDNYSTALGIPISIRNTTEGELITKLSNVSKLWSLIQRTPEVETKLMNILKDAMDKCYRTGQVIIFERHPDTQAFLAPIHLGGRIVAFFVGGLVRFGNPDMQIAAEQAQKLGVDLDTYLDAYLSLPFLNKERFEASATLIKLIGNTISTFETEGSEIKVKQQEMQQKNLQLAKNLEKTSKQLDSSLDRYKQLFDTINDGIYLANFNEETFIDINQAGTAMLGYKNPQELLGKKVGELYVNPQERFKYIEILKEKGTIKNWIAQIQTPFGEKKYLETSATLITDKHTGKILMQGIFRDIENL
jgi:PAS domain S-box-containing protein